MMILRFSLIPLALLPSLVNADNNWSKLDPELSYPTQKTSFEVWHEQCIKPFDFATEEGKLSFDSYAGVSNLDLLEQESGLCMQTAACVFEGCKGIFGQRYLQQTCEYPSMYQSIQSDFCALGEYPVLKDEDIVTAASGKSELPKVVVHPGHPGDITEAIRFAADDLTGISVKTTGSSWMGSSTRKGTALLNLRKLKKFALPETLNEAIFDCTTEITTFLQRAAPSRSDIGSVLAACRLAGDRGKSAIMRVGGGQTVDEGLRTIEAWNSDADRHPYHAMIETTSTMPLAGGWLFSGGLGGSTNMRKYGYGIDQVLHIEMVLPDGRFVRFGPSRWKKADGDQLYPQTTEVTGFCNEGDPSKEVSWSWIDCDDKVDFADLWFAVRGGGGGWFGVVTSVYYQLHDKPSKFQEVAWGPSLKEFVIDPSKEVEVGYDMAVQFNNFLFNFLYNPSKIGVSPSMSTSCSASDGSPGSLICYDGAAEYFVEAWAEYGNGEMPLAVTIEETSFLTFVQKLRPPEQTGAGHILNFHPNEIVFPIDIFTNKLDEFLSIYVPCLIDTFNDDRDDMCLDLPFFYGGNSRFTSDGMDALPSFRRNGVLEMKIYKQSVKEEFKRLIWGVPTDKDGFVGETFPGIYDHNNIKPTTSPRKSNWLEECNSGGLDDGTPTTSLYDSDCMSLQEASFGTETLQRLEKIHAKIDRSRLFQTSDGPGYASSDIEDEEESAMGTHGDYSDAASDHSVFLLGGCLIFSLTTALAF